VRHTDKVVIWPVYIDSSRSRKEGRRISKKNAVSSPKLSELIGAAQELGLNPEPKSEAAHPRIWWEKTGFIFLKKKRKKSHYLLQLSHNIIQSRNQQPTLKKKKK
jgi:signal recognition particle subunit SRP19